MIYVFRIISNEVEDFFRDIEIKSSQTFYQLHSAIQYDADWDSSQLASFFLTDDSWEKGEEISLIDITGNTLLMDKTKLEKFFGKEKQKLVYTFDVMADRSLFIELKKIKDEDEDSRQKYPVCSNGDGDFPSQVLIKGGKKQADIFDESDFDIEESFDDSHDDNL